MYILEYDIELKLMNSDIEADVKNTDCIARDRAEG